MYCVYKIVNDINNKVYVGRTIRNIDIRWSEHVKAAKNSNKRHIYCAMRKYGLEHFSIILLETYKSLSDVIKKEAYYCKKLNAYTDGYNMTTAGEVNPMDCAISKQSHDTIMRDPDVRLKISATMKKVRVESKDWIYIFKDRCEKRINPADLHFYLQQGWQRGTVKGKIRIHRDNKESSIWPELLNTYLNDGWSIGGKADRISAEHRLALDKSHFKKVFAITPKLTQSPVFNSVKQACDWWFNALSNDNIKIAKYIVKNHYSLANYIKKSYDNNIAVFGYTWQYIKGGDVNE